MSYPVISADKPEFWVGSSPDNLELTVTKQIEAVKILKTHFDPFLFSIELSLFYK